MTMSAEVMMLPDVVKVNEPFTVKATGLDPDRYANVLVLDARAVTAYTPGVQPDGTLMLEGVLCYWDGPVAVEVRQRRPNGRWFIVASCDGEVVA